MSTSTRNSRPAPAPQVVNNDSEFNAVNQWSLRGFMREHEVTTAQVIRNPHTQKLFVSFGPGLTAALSSRLGDQLDGSETVSEMEDGAFIVHVTNDNTENVVSTFSL